MVDLGVLEVFNLEIELSHAQQREFAEIMLKNLLIDGKISDQEYKIASQHI